jgi:ankyrin repeat protein
VNEQSFAKCLSGSIDTLDEYGWNPLFYAIFWGNIPFADKLINQGATINQLDKYGMTPLMYAIKMNDVQLIKFLITRGASIIGSQRITDVLEYAQHFADETIVDYIKLVMKETFLGDDWAAL